MHARTITILVAVLMLAPAALAWGGKGEFEPSTSFDRSGSYMWGTPDVATGLRGTRVYFSSFNVQNSGYGAQGFTPNPNLATVQSSRANWPGQLAAFLGVWKDCNKDGFIGWGDNGILEYRAELLAVPNANGVIPSTGVCPVGNPGAVPAGAASHGWVGVHNDGQWVREYMPLGPDLSDATLPDNNPWDLNDNGARVWADWGKPADPPPTSRCFIVFVPEGTHRSTGGLLAYGDCLTDYSVTDSLTTVGNAGADGTPAGQVSFKDKPRDQGNSVSALNRGSPWGDPTGPSYASAFDCSSPQLVHVDPPAISQEFGVSQPKTPTVDTGGSVAATVNETATAADDCDRSDNGNEWEGQAAAGPYSLDDAGIHNGVGLRIASDFPMAYSEGKRPLVPTNPLGKAMATDGGLRAWDAEGFWISGPRILEDRNPYASRPGLGSSAIAPAQYVTAYASISSGAISTYGLTFPTGTSAMYGSDACTGGIGTGAAPSNNWECDPAKWIADCGEHYECSGMVDGKTVDMSVKVGQTYQLRDVDCYDHSVGAARQQGVGWGVLTGTACV